MIALHYDSVEIRINGETISTGANVTLAERRDSTAETWLKRLSWPYGFDDELREPRNRHERRKLAATRRGRS